MCAGEGCVCDGEGCECDGERCECDGEGCQCVLGRDVSVCWGKDLSVGKL